MDNIFLHRGQVGVNILKLYGSFKVNLAYNICSVHLKPQTFQMCITRLFNIADTSTFSITRIDRLCLHIH